MKPPHTGMPLEAYAPTRNVGSGMTCPPALSALGAAALPAGWTPSAAAADAFEPREQPTAHIPVAAAKKPIHAPPRNFALTLLMKSLSLLSRSREVPECELLTCRRSRRRRMRG